MESLSTFKEYTKYYQYISENSIQLFLFVNETSKLRFKQGGITC